MKRDKYVNIILGSSDWDLYHRKEFTKELINNGEEIAFINQPVSLLLNLIFKFRSRFIAYLTGKFKINKRNGFLVYTPLMMTHFLLWRNIPLIAKIDSSFISVQINHFTSKFYPDWKVRLWVFMPEHKYFIGNIRYDLLIYDSYDDCDLNYDGSVNNKRTNLNKTLLHESDFVIVISEYTFKKYSKYARNIFRSRGGYSPNIFNNILKEINVIYSDKPILGYIGTFRDWIDYSLINRLVESKSFVIVFLGYIDRSSKKYFKGLLKKENVIHINYVDISQVPLYLNNFAAGIIPFKVNDFMKSVYPNKFFEYLSSKIPVITTALPELEIFKDYIGYSIDNDAFINNCKKAVEGKYIDKIVCYDNIVRNNDWNIIVKEILVEISKLN